MRPFDYPIQFYPLWAFGEPDEPPHLDPEEADRVANLINLAGWPFPVVIDRAGYTAAGAARLEAARLIEHVEVPTVLLENLTVRDLEVLRAADARLASQTFGTGHLLQKDHRLLEKLGQVEAAPDIEPPPPSNPAPAREIRPITQRGDLWRIGRHQVFCSDARFDFYETFGDTPADIAFLDPPQNIAGHMKADTHVVGVAHILHQTSCATRLGALIALCADWRQLEVFLRMARVLRLPLRDFWVWTGAQGGTAGALYEAGLKSILVFRHGGPHINNLDLAASPPASVLDFPADPAFPSALPPALLARVIEDATPKNGSVLQVCAGPGAAGLYAAEATGRSARIVEGGARRCDVILRRFAEATGATPTLDGVTMDEVAKSRSAKDARR